MRGTLDKAWLERVEGAGIRRAGPTWAVGQDYVVGNADPDHGSDWDERHLFRSRIRPLLRAEIDRDRDPVPTQWIPLAHMIQPTVRVSSAVHYDHPFFDGFLRTASFSGGLIRSNFEES